MTLRYLPGVLSPFCALLGAAILSGCVATTDSSSSSSNRAMSSLGAVVSSSSAWVMSASVPSQAASSLPVSLFSSSVGVPSSTPGISSSTPGISSKASESSMAASSLGSLGGASAYETYFRPLVADRCVLCHSGEHGVMQAPMFVHRDAVFGEYELIAAGKVDFDNPEQSRIVKKIADMPLHNCGQTLEACQALAAELAAGIANWSAAQGSVGANATSPIQSKPLTLADAQLEPPTGERRGQPIAEYDFANCEGGVIRDISGVAPALNLTMTSGLECVLSLGLVVPSGSFAVGSVADSRKIYDAIAGSQGSKELTVEAWVKVANLPTRTVYGAIVAYAPREDEDAANLNYNPTPTNFYLANYMGTRGVYAEIFDHIPQVDGTGGVNARESHIGVAGMRQEAEGEYVHLAATFNGSQAQLFIDGQLVGTRAMPHAPGFGWRDDFKLFLGKTFFERQTRGGLMEFSGIIGYTAVYADVLSADDIANNAAVRPERRNILSFDVSAAAGAPGTYITMGIRSLGSKGYVLSAPTLKGTTASGVMLKGLRVLVNGRMNTQGQPFSTLVVNLDNDGQVLSPLGGVIMADKGPQTDVFNLAFDQLGGQSFVRNPVIFPKPIITADGRPSIINGVKTFSQLHSAFSGLLGLDPKSPSASAIYERVKASLPPTSTLQSMKPTYQLIIANTAFEYCEAMMQEPGLPQQFFNGVNLNGNLDVPKIAAISEATYNNLVKAVGGILTLAEYQTLTEPFMQDLMASNLSAKAVATSICGSTLASAMVITH